MRNKYPGVCYRCGKIVKEKKGHFERYQGRWRTQHADCAIKFRNTDVRYKKPCVNTAHLKHLISNSISD